MSERCGRLLPSIQLTSVLLICALQICGVLGAADHGIQVQAVSPWNDPQGYTPVVVTVDALREVDLDLVVDNESSSAHGTVHVPGGRPTRQTLLIPPTGRDSFSLNQLTWSGPDGVRNGTPISGGGHQQIRCVLIDPKQLINEPTLEAALAKVTSSSGSSRRDLLQRIQPEDLPDRWQGYPDWLVLVLTPQGDAALDDAQRQAITAWSRSGGSLVVTSNELLNAWQGRLAQVALDPLDGRAEVLGKNIEAHIAQDSWQPQDAPVPGTETVPVKTFVFLALAFAIVVGPLNLWWVRRRNARHLFLITTPLISFVTCVVLIVASLIADGMSIRRDAVQVICIDHRTQQVVRWTGCSYFAAFARSRLDLDLQAKVRVLDRDEYGNRFRRGRDEGERLSIDWRQGQQISGSILPARLNRQLSYTELLPERRRLVVTRTATGYQVVNGLGVGLQSVAWRDAESKLWLAGVVANGAGEALHAATPAELSKLRDRQTLSAGAALPSRVTNRIGRELGPYHDLVTNQPLTFCAILAAPMDPLPGPVSEDPEKPEVIAFGFLPLASAAEATP